MPVTERRQEQRLLQTTDAFLVRVAFIMAKMIPVEVEVGEGLVVLQGIRQCLRCANVKSNGQLERCFDRRKQKASKPQRPI